MFKKLLLTLTLLCGLAIPASASVYSVTGTNGIVCTNNFSQPICQLSGATSNYLDTTANSGLSYATAPGSNGLLGGNAFLSWNCTSTGGEVCLSTGSNMGVTASFWHTNGSVAVKSSQIDADGTYRVASSTYGPTSASVNGNVVATTGYVSAQYNSGAPGGGPNNLNAYLSWNCSSSGGEACLSTGFTSGTTTASFWHNNGTSQVLSSKILYDGTYQAGSSLFGPTNTYINGSLAAGTATAGTIMAGASNCPSSILAGAFCSGMSATTGGIYFGNNGVRYLYWNGSEYQFGTGGNVHVYSNVIVDNSVQIGTCSTYLPGDICSGRSGGTTGAYFFGNTGNHYLYWDGSSYRFGAVGSIDNVSMYGNLTLTGSLTSGQITTSAGNDGDGILMKANGNYNTYFGTNGSQSVAGVTGDALKIYNNGAGANLLALQRNGNMGIAGTYFSVSSRKFKDNIKPIEPGKALKLVDQTTIVRFCYKMEHCKPGETRHVGFIAEDTSTDLAPHHNSMDLGAVELVDLQAIKELHAEFESLKHQVPLGHTIAIHQPSLFVRIHEFIFGN